MPSFLIGRVDLQAKGSVTALPRFGDDTKELFMDEHKIKCAA